MTAEHEFFLQRLKTFQLMSDQSIIELFRDSTVDTKHDFGLDLVDFKHMLEVLCIGEELDVPAFETFGNFDNGSVASPSVHKVILDTA